MESLSSLARATKKQRFLAEVFLTRPDPHSIYALQNAAIERQRCRWLAT